MHVWILLCLREVHILRETSKVVEYTKACTPIECCMLKEASTKKTCKDDFLHNLTLGILPLYLILWM